MKNSYLQRRYSQIPTKHVVTWEKTGAAFRKLEVFTLPHRFLPDSGHSCGFLRIPEEYNLAEGPAKLPFRGQIIPEEYSHSGIDTGMFPGMHRNGIQPESGPWNICMLSIDIINNYLIIYIHIFRTTNIWSFSALHKYTWPACVTTSTSHARSSTTTTTSQRHQRQQQQWQQRQQDQQRAQQPRPAQRRPQWRRKTNTSRQRFAMDTSTGPLPEDSTTTRGAHRYVFFCIFFSYPTNYFAPDTSQRVQRSPPHPTTKTATISATLTRPTTTTSPRRVRRLQQQGRAAAGLGLETRHVSSPR